MKSGQTKNCGKKGIRSKLLKFIRRVCCGFNDLVPHRPPLVKPSSTEFNVEKWHRRIQKTCHDFDAMEMTFNTSSQDATIKSIRTKGDVYRSELHQMQMEIQTLRREKEMIQRGLQTRQSRRSQRLRRARNSKLVRDHQRYLRYRSDSAYSTSTPSGSTYQSNDTNVFYVFL